MKFIKYFQKYRFGSHSLDEFLVESSQDLIELEEDVQLGFSYDAYDFVKSLRWYVLSDGTMPPAICPLEKEGFAIGNLWIDSTFEEMKKIRTNLLSNE